MNSASLWRTCSRGSGASAYLLIPSLMVHIDNKTHITVSSWTEPHYHHWGKTGREPGDILLRPDLLPTLGINFCTKGGLQPELVCQALSPGIWVLGNMHYGIWTQKSRPPLWVNLPSYGTLGSSWLLDPVSDVSKDEAPVWTYCLFLIPLNCSSKHPMVNSSCDSQKNGKSYKFRLQLWTCVYAQLWVCKREEKFISYKWNFKNVCSRSWLLSSCNPFRELIGSDSSHGLDW